jgi:long-chain acyl-CoA synthetase
LEKSTDTRLDVLIDRRLGEKPDERCLWWNGTWYDRAYLKGLADAAEQRLAEAGFSKGQRLVIMTPNSPMVLALSIATWRLGGSVAPLNAKAGAASLSATLRLLDPFAVVTASETRGDVQSVLDELALPHALCPPMGPLPAFSGGGRPQVREVREGEDELAVIFSTSGTTGAPKAVPLTHANLISNCIGCIHILKALRPRDVFLNVLPNFHAFGFTACTLLPFFSEAAQAIVPGFMPPQNTVRAMAAAQPNVVILVPTMLYFLLGLLEREGGDKDPARFGDIKLVITGGDRLNTAMDEKSKALLGKNVLEGYGITECSPVVAVNDCYERRRLGTVGEFLDWCSWRLRGEDGSGGDAVNPADGEGVLWVKGGSVCSGYFRLEESDRSRFDDGWFNTGDYVKIDGGYVKVLDRVKDIIIVGGFNVYPQEVEAVLAEHPAVQTAVVVGMPHSVSGEVPKACVVKKPGAEASETDLIRYCKERLSHYQVPRKVEFMDSLPTSAAGKVLRRLLK